MGHQAAISYFEYYSVKSAGSKLKSAGWLSLEPLQLIFIEKLCFRWARAIYFTVKYSYSHYCYSADYFWCLCVRISYIFTMKHFFRSLYCLWMKKVSFIGGVEWNSIVQPTSNREDTSFLLERNLCDLILGQILKRRGWILFKL